MPFLSVVLRAWVVDKTMFSSIVFVSRLCRLFPLHHGPWLWRLRLLLRHIPRDTLLYFLLELVHAASYSGLTNVIIFKYSSDAGRRTSTDGSFGKKQKQNENKQRREKAGNTEREMEGRSSYNQSKPLLSFRGETQAITLQ